MTKGLFARQKNSQGSQFVTRAALDLASKYYDDDMLKRKDLRPTKLVGFEGIARHRNVNIMLYEPKKDWERMQHPYVG